jgi:aldehyde:ferredoxin oxidoreductase
MAKETHDGYNGLILRVNLSTRSTSFEELDPVFCRRYIGGAGFAIYYLWKELKPGIDALGPDNKLIFALGPVSGLTLPGAARHCVCAKSPLTGGIAKAEAGGFWGAELKRAGYDAIIIEGKADKPVYLWIHDKEAAIRDAGPLWGKETKETESAVRAELGDERVQLASIGPGGEHLVRYACIMHGLFDAAGRGGLGAVMGSKNLKAVAVRGSNLPEIANQEHLKEIRQQSSQQPHAMSQFGTGGNMTAFEANGNLPVHNFRDGLFPDVKLINSGAIKETIRIGMEGCFACPVRCKKVVQVTEPYAVDPAYGGPEYETLASLGSNCGIGDLKAIAKASERCNAYALDTISTGVTIGFAMECFEKGFLSNSDTDGIDLRFGNANAMLKVIDLIANRHGIGNLLAEGSARMAKNIGKGSEQFAMQVKGLECGLHEPRFT